MTRSAVFFRADVPGRPLRPFVEETAGKYRWSTWPK